MIRRKENAKQEVKQERVVGIVEIPITAEADCIMKRDRAANRSRRSAHTAPRRAVAPLPPATVIRVDLINLLNDLEAELRRFHRKVRRVQDEAA